MENVTEELVRQNGNQAAAVMADYVEQGGGGGSTGIPSISKNGQPNIVWREPTEEDLAKLPQGLYSQVADLPEKGNLPLFLAYPYHDDYGLKYLEVLSQVEEMENGGVDVIYFDYRGEKHYTMDNEWSILAMQGEG